MLDVDDAKQSSELVADQAESLPRQEVAKGVVALAVHHVAETIIVASVEDSIAELGFEEYAVAPEGWFSANKLAKELGCGRNAVLGVLESHREEQPSWFQRFKALVNNVSVEYLHPEAVTLARTTILESRPPEGWMTNKRLATELSMSHAVTGKLVRKFQEDNPKLTGVVYVGSNGHPSEHLPPELIEKIRQRYTSRKLKPEGWMTNNALANELGVDMSTTKKIAVAILEANPELVKPYLNDRGNVVKHYGPKLVQTIRDRLADRLNAPEGWISRKRIANTLGCAENTIDRLIDKITDRSDGWIKNYSVESGHKATHLSPDLVSHITEVVNSRQDAPDGWMTISGIGKELKVADKTVEHLLESHVEDFEKASVIYKDKIGTPRVHFSPDLIDTLRSIVEVNKFEKESSEKIRTEQATLHKDLREFLTDIDEDCSLEAHEYRELVQLFGAERAVDILYHYRPEYSKLAVPYVRSTLADYLGDFMNIKGQFSLDSLEKSTRLLVEPSFREGMTEIVKSDCLRLLNQLGKTDISTVNMQTVVEYLNHIREQTTYFTTPELQEIINEVEAYYQLLFEDVHKPDSFVDELVIGRQFPDINQRINVQEIAFKHRVLIADEMGTGKSASAIMAKEIVGVKRALIIVPSNVVEVWQTYLSDGEGGYFRPGQTPRVLTIDSLEDLQNLETEDFDYIIISQERLSEAYVEGLRKSGYNMLITDEMHKLKNLVDGKRAEQLLQLAEHVEGRDKYLVLLSGTPVPNKVSDVAMTFKLLYPDQFKEVSNKDLVNQILNGDILDLRSLLVPRMQMKTLAESIEMPQLKHENHRFSLSPQAQEIYNVLMEEDELTATQKMQILRQFVLNPKMLDATPNILNDKVQVVSNELQKTFATKNKVVMFVNGYIEGVMRGETSILDDLNIPPGITVLTIDGTVSKVNRLTIQQELRRSNKKILLIVSGQTADVGVDFSAAEEVYFYNEPWTEYDKRQQLGRVYRPGLKNDLICHTFIAAGTIEEGIHRYVEAKYKAVEKLLRGVPISELEKEMLRKSETQEQGLEVNPELAEYYFSSWDKMMKIYSHVKELGEEDFVKFLSRYDKEYANSYADLVGSRSYQANVGRLSGTIISGSVKSQGQNPSDIRIVDIASGPEMLKKHMSEELQDNIISIDINKHHFSAPGISRAVGSLLELPIADESVDYANMSLALHYTNFLPRSHKYERLQAMKELNRVLRVGGRGIVSMIYTLGLKDGPEFRDLLDKLGFRVVETLTGEAESGKHFKSQVITLDKTKNSTTNLETLASEIGPESLKSLKFSKSKTSLRDPRKIVTAFSLGRRLLSTVLNQEDRKAQIEEEVVTNSMEQLKSRYGSVKAIPREVIYNTGFSRIFNGKRYVLFKRLNAGSGAVVIN